MRKTMIFIALAGALVVQGCQQKMGAPEQEGTKMTNSMPASNNLKACDVRLGNVAFRYALNGGDSCVVLNEDFILAFHCTQGRDFFCDPNGGKLTNSTIPAIFTEVDNTKPFTFVAKVTPEFTKEGVYNAADLLVYANDTLWQKLCFEQDERGRHRIVTVRTQGTSDDNNHEKLTVSSVYLKFSSDTRTLASYYSLDKKEWQMVRLYKNYYPDKIWVGIASQCPKAGTCTSLFEEVSFEQASVDDFRLGN